MRLSRVIGLSSLLIGVPSALVALGQLQATGWWSIAAEASMYGAGVMFVGWAGYWARKPVTRFFDGTIKARDYWYVLRTWAMLVLIEKRKMAHREALTFWNERAPNGPHYQFSVADRQTQTGESLLSQELRRLRQRIKRWHSD